jgi:hypothetical protein
LKLNRGLYKAAPANIILWRSDEDRHRISMFNQPSPNNHPGPQEKTKAIIRFG